MCKYLEIGEAWHQEWVIWWSLYCEKNVFTSESSTGDKLVLNSQVIHVIHVVSRARELT